MLTLRDAGEPKREPLDAFGGEILRTPQLSPGGVKRWTRHFLRSLVRRGRSSSGSTRFGGAPSSRGRSRTLAREIIENCFFPDPEITWALPAVRVAMRAIRDRHIDVLYSTSPPESSHVLALWLRRLSGLPWVMDLRDSWSFDSLKNPVSTFALRQRLEASVERKCFRAASRVVVSSPATARSYDKLYPEYREKISVIPNGVDLGELDEARERAMRTEEPTPWTPAASGELLFAHAGTLCRYGWHDVSLGPFFDALGGVEAFRSGRARLVLAGNVSESVNDSAREAGLDGVVEFPGPLAHLDALRLFLSADRLLLFDPLGDGGTYIHGKLYEYLACERPIVSVVPEGASRALLEEYGQGLIARPDDTASIRAVFERACGVDEGELSVAPFDADRFDRRILTEHLVRELSCARDTDCIARAEP